jgi:hypothetical protein
MGQKVLDDGRLYHVLSSGTGRCSRHAGRRPGIHLFVPVTVSRRHRAVVIRNTPWDRIRQRHPPAADPACHAARCIEVSPASPIAVYDAVTPANSPPPGSRLTVLLAPA